MQIGIGHPGTIPAVKGQLILDWARRADAGPFSSLGSLDRLVYSNYDALITLTAAAAVTQRIRLMTTVLLVPLHNAGLLAKQAASLDAISGGRLTLGVGVGGREDDFRAAPASWHDRGKRFEAQLDTMKRAWSGQTLAEDIGPVGPPQVPRHQWRVKAMNLLNKPGKMLVKLVNHGLSQECTGALAPMRQSGWGHIFATTMLLWVRDLSRWLVLFLRHLRQ